ncbi:MAG: sensor histidine kinase [Bacillota bacterium]
MSIKKKLIIMLLITILVVMGVYYHTLSKAVELAINGPDKHLSEKLRNNKEYIKISNDVEKVIKTFNDYIFNNPKILINNEKLLEFEKSLKSDFVGFDIKINNKMTYHSLLQKNKYKADKYPDLHSASDFITPNRRNFLYNKEKLRIIKQIDFQLKNGSDGSIYIFIKRDLLSIIKSNILFTTVFISLFLIIVLSIFISIYIYKSISKPLTSVIDGVEKIKKGNLDFKFEKSNTDEISKLSTDFDKLRKKLLKQKKIRKKYEKDRKEFIANITHDINTPITAANMNVQALIDGYITDKSKKQRYLKNIKVKLASINKLIDELSLISNLNLQDEQIKFLEVDIYDFIKDIVDELKYDKKYEKVKFIFNNKKDKEKRYIKIDVQKMRRAILNIFENSLKHSDKENLKIYINIFKDNKKINLSIEDNGKGIKKDYKNLFQRFYKEDESRNVQNSGSGLGLSIVKKIIDINNGEVYAKKSRKFDSGLKIVMVFRSAYEDINN